MSHEPFAELASAYALGALDGDDRVRFEAHLSAGCPPCEAALRDYAEVLGGLGTDVTPVAPPPAVRARLLERVAADAGPARREPVSQAAPPASPAPPAAPAPPARPAVVRPAPPARPAAPARSGLGWPLAWAATVAAAAAVVFYLWTTVGDLRREMAVREAQLAALRVRLAALAGETARQQEQLALLRAPETHVVALAGQPASPEAHGRMWWNGQSRRGLFVTSGLPPAPADKTYQLWVISEGKPISAGVFAVDAAGTGVLPVGPIAGAVRADAFAVTLEPAGGLPAPSGSMYLVGKPT
jgi:anti-sigma-K factor RskA